MWNKLFGVFVNMIFFMMPIFHTYLSIRGIHQESGQLQYFCILLFALAIFFYAKFYVFGQDHISYRHILIFVGMGVIGALYCLTSAIYGNMPSEYYSTLLYWGSMCTSSVLAGIMINDDIRLVEVSRLIPFFTMPITMSVAVFAYSGADMVYDNDYNWNYQAISYFMAKCFLFNAYYLFFFKRNQHSGLNNKIIKLLVFITMIANLFLELNAGGRGATVLIIFGIAYLLFYLFKNNVLSLPQILLVCLCFICFFLISANHLNLWESSGFYRVTHMLEYDTEARENSYSLALQYWEQSPFIGYGIGSIWHTVGFYSHNFIFDLLAECGFIGACIILVFLTITLGRLYKFMTVNKLYVLVMFYAFTGLIMLLFSGYWIQCEALWFTIAVVWSLDWNSVQKRNIYMFK